MRILYVFPHPDDESYGPGHAMHKQRRQGHEVYLLTLTRGGATRQRLKYGYTIEQNVSAAAPMFIAMLGIKADTPSGLSFILEAGYRRARIDGLTGETDEGETWSMYAFEQYHAELDYWRYRNSLYRELPTGADVRGAEETSIDLSGLTVRLGIMVRF